MSQLQKGEMRSRKLRVPPRPYASAQVWLGFGAKCRPAGLSTRQVDHSPPSLQRLKSRVPSGVMRRELGSEWNASISHQILAAGPKNDDRRGVRPSESASRPLLWSILHGLPHHLHDVHGPDADAVLAGGLAQCPHALLAGRDHDLRAGLLSLLDATLAHGGS